MRYYPTNTAKDRATFVYGLEAVIIGDAHGKAVDPITADDLTTGTRGFLAEDLLAGYAIRPDGELVAVWALVRGRGNGIVADAIANGATKLVCYDGHLTKLYARHGFEVVTRTPWNDEYAPEGWDYDTLGRPDYLEMELPRT